MALWSWWPGDEMPRLAPLAGFGAQVAGEPALVARLAGLSVDEVERRIEAGHQPYVGWVDGEPVAYGWSAAVTAEVGELGVGLSLGGDDRYLWDFATLPAWRGRGIYPQLLQAMIVREGLERRYWIINAPENVASGRGIAKAGFGAVGELSFLPSDGVGAVPLGSEERARVGVRLLGVPLLARGGEPVVSPCWGCVIGARERGEPAVCWPPSGTGTACGCGGA